MNAFIKKKIKEIFYNLIKPLRSFLNGYNERAIYLFLEALRKTSLENSNSNLLTEFKIYPKYPKRLFPIQSKTDNLTIIIQGPILNKSFLQGSIDWYRSCGINNIIVSSNDKDISLRNANIIYSPKSNIRGLGNENNHLNTTKNALKNIPDNQIVIKTRSDMRIYNELALSAIPYNHQHSKSKNTIDGLRLGCISNNSLLMKINNISDHLYIGSALQLKRMFSLSERKEKETINKIKVNSDLLYRRESDNTWMLKSTKYTSIFSEFYGEQWFFNSFRKNCLNTDLSEKQIIDYSDYIKALKDYLNIIKECIYVLDPEELDLYWLKQNFYTLPSYYHNKFQNPYPIPCMRLTRLNWLSLSLDNDYINKIINYANTLNIDESLL